MGKYIGIGIIPCLRPVFAHIGLRQHLAVCRHNLAPDYPVRKRILPSIIRAVNKIIAFDAVEINQIPDHADKDDSKENGNKGILFISGFALFRNLFLPLLQQLSVSLSSPLLVDVSQFLRPRPLYKYTGPG